MNLKSLEEVLHESRKYIVEDTLDTIFAIMGNENQNSSLLAYYMSSENGHNFYKYFIGALYKLLDIKEDYGNVRTYTEYDTGKGRIDIVIETDSWIIGIKNKIYHHLDNDFEDYHNTLQELAKGKAIDDKKVKLCLLTLNPFTNHPYFKEYNEKHSSNKCKNITHLALWETVFERIEFTRHILDKHMIILNYINENIKKLTKGNSMEPHKIKFLYENTKEINNIIDLVREYENHQRNQFSIIRDELNNQEYFIESGFARVKCKDCIVDDLILYFILNTHDDREIVIDIVQSSKMEDEQWKVIIYEYKDKKRELTHYLQKHLERISMSFDLIKYDGCDRALLYKSNNRDDVIEKVIEFAKKHLERISMSFDLIKYDGCDRALLYKSNNRDDVIE